MTTQDLVLWGIALLVSIYFGVLGVRGVKSRRKQTQNTSANSTAVQSGRDSNINNVK